MNETGSERYSIRLNTDQLTQDAQNARRELHNIGTTAETEGRRIDNSFDKIGQNVRRLGQYAAGFFAVSKLKEYGEQVAKVRGEFQQLEIAFKTMLGSASQADKLMQQLIKTAATTPFGMSDIANSAKQLLAYGVAADEVNETLIRLGDIAAGLSIPINDLAYLYGTTMTQGRVFTQDLRQFMGRGIPLADELAKQFGVTKEKVGELVTAGKVGFPEVKKALWDLTNEGSKFGGLMEAQSKTITGQISNIEDAIEQMFNDLGKSSEGMISDALGVVSELVENYEQVGRVIIGLIGTYGTYKTAVMTLTAIQGLQTAGVGALTAAETVHYGWLVLCEKAQALLNKTMLSNPYVLVATAIAGIVAALWSMKSAQERVNDEYNNYISKKDDVIKKEQEHKARIEELTRVAGDESLSTDSRRLALVKLEQKYPSIFKKYDTEIEKLNHIRDIKLEIAALEGQKSLANTANELTSVESQIRDIENALKSRQTGNSGKYEDKFVGVHMQTLQDRLKALQRRKEELSKQKTRDDANTYMSNLTGISNDDLKKQINERRNLLAQMETTGRKYGKVQRGGATGVFTQEEIQGQLQLLQSEQTRRKKILEDGSKDFVKEAESAYKKEKAALTLLRSLSDPKKRKDSDLVLGGKKVSEMGSEEYFAALEAQEKAVEEARKKARVKKETNSGDSEAKRLLDEAAERGQAINEYKKRVIAETASAELEIRQAQIDNQRDGFEKQRLQIGLNYDKLIAENKKREQEMLEALADEKVTEWKNNNPKATKAQEIQYKESLKLTAADLSKEQRDILEAFDEAAEEYLTRSNKTALEQMLSDVLTYQQQRTKIEEDFARRRAQMYEKNDNGTFKTDSNGNKIARQGVTQANFDELDRQEQQAVKAIDEQFAQREVTYEAWCNEIANLSLKQLESVLEKAKAELESLENSGTATDQQLATARAKVNKSQDALKKAKAKDELNPGKRSLKEWEDLYKTLTDCEKEFESIGDAVGGTAGEIIKTAGQIASSTLTMINGIVQLVNMSATGMTTAAGTASTAIATMEKASVILTIIAAAIQLATIVASLFNDDDEKQKEIERLQNRIDQLQWELDNQDIVRLQTRQGTAIQLINDAIAETCESLSDEYAKLGQIHNIWEMINAQASLHETLMRESAQRIATAYANMAYTADKAIGADRFASARQQLENYAQQQLLIQEQIENERSKKDTDYGQIEEWERKIEELGEKALTLINEMVEDIIGGSSQDIAKQLSDAFFEAFEAGEDAAEKWGDKVNEIVADVIKRMMVSKFLEEPLGDIFNKYKAKWFKDGNFAGIDAVIASMEGFRYDLNNTYDAYAQVMEAIPEDLRELFMNTDRSRTAAEKGIAQASQDSVDELNGRATTIQSHTYSIAESTRLLLQTSNSILHSVLNIETHTEGMKSDIATLRSDMREVRETVSDLQLRGIKIKS